MPYLPFDLVLISKDVVFNYHSLTSYLRYKEIAFISGRNTVFICKLFITCEGYSSVIRKFGQFSNCVVPITYSAGDSKSASTSILWDSESGLSACDRREAA